MKIATFVYEGQQSWGLVVENPTDNCQWVYEPWKLEMAFRKVANGTNGYFRCLPNFMPDQPWPKTVKEFLEMGETGMERLKKLETFLCRYVQQSDPYYISCVGHKLSDVRLRCPVPDAGLFLGLVQNSPSFFRVNPARHHVNILPQAHQRSMTSVIGSGETFLGAPGGNVELGIVIGKECYNVPIEEAYDYVAGFVVVHDCQVGSFYHEFDPEAFRENRLFKTYTDWFADANCSWMGKGADSHCICGPYITTKDEIGNPYDLDVMTLTNGCQRDHSSTAGYLIGVERIVHFYASFMTLHPGDIIHMGTVGTDGIAVDLDYMPFDNNGTIGSWIEQCGEIHAAVYYPEKFGDTRSEAQKKIPIVPTAQDYIDREDTQIGNFDLNHVQSMWTCFGNFQSVDEVMGWTPNPISPRMLNGPRTQLTDKSGTDLHLAPIAADLEIACEMAFVVKKQGKAIGQESAGAHLLGIAPVLSVCDLSIRNKIVEPATPQEASIGLVYGRWGDGYQTIGQVKDVPLAGRKMTLTAEHVGTVTCSTDEYLVGEKRTLEYLTHATTVLAGDVVTLGRLGKTLTIPAGSYNNGLKLTLEVEGFAPVSRTIYPFKK